MKIKIYRGTHEIGGSCVEIFTENSRIVIDLGMPLVDKEGNKFKFEQYKHLSGPELIKKDILPEVKDLYYWDEGKNLPDGLLISHPHQDHYGFINYINKEIPVYLGKAAEDIICLTGLFTPIKGKIKNSNHIKSGTSFKCGEFKITPYLMDHSGYDAYSYLVETKDKKVIYTGDFREHGYKEKAFYYFLNKVSDNINVIILEGTSFGREEKEFKDEEKISEEIGKISKETKGITFFHQSSQNIDRLISFFKASLRTDKTFIIDIYTAHVLSTIHNYNNNIPYPSEDFSNIRVFYPWNLTRRLEYENKKDLLREFGKYKITRNEIARDSKNIMMLLRPSMISDLQKINSLNSSDIFKNSSFIYSRWSGYLNKDKGVQDLVDLLKDQSLDVNIIHTSGHASIKTLKKVAERINPDKIIPIHTFHPDKFHKLPGEILKLKDGQTVKI